MKKLLVIAIAAFAFTACNNAAKPEGESTDTTAKTEATQPEATTVDTTVKTTVDTTVKTETAH